MHVAYICMRTIAISRSLSIDGHAMRARSISIDIECIRPQVKPLEFFGKTPPQRCIVLTRTLIPDQARVDLRCAYAHNARAPTRTHICIGN
jgi:hypothetical protein